MGMSYLYSSTDISAPALIDGVGYLVQVLDKVLVEGYGDKSGLGWTKEYNSPDGKIVCYRNKGTGFFLRVNNSINYATKTSLSPSAPETDDYVNISDSTNYAQPNNIYTSIFDSLLDLNKQLNGMGCSSENAGDAISNIFDKLYNK